MSIAESYNAWSVQYDSNTNKTRDLDIKSTIDTLSQYHFDNVLELGCGTGKNTQWLLKHAKQIIGLDFSENMLAVAKKKIVNPKVTFKKADLNQRWDIKNESVDLVTSSLTLEHIENLDHIFNQAYQKLKVNGLFFISELHPFKQYLGSKARFETDNGLVELEVYTHHVSDYLLHAEKNSFSMLTINEWFDEDAEKNIPRLISFVFQKK